MSRYIDKDFLLCELNSFIEAEKQGYGDSLEVIRNSIVDMSEADVVEVVRCKNCKWWEKDNDGLQGCCVLHQSYPTGGWYCANGERKESE